MNMRHELWVQRAIFKAIEDGEKKLHRKVTFDERQKIK
jgi:ASC-1-like (ASCH) protein